MVVQMKEEQKKISKQDLFFIVGIIVIIVLIISMGTYAFVSWRSPNEDNSLRTKIGNIATVKFDNGVSLNTDTLYPVLNYEDGISATFSVSKTINDAIYTKLYLSIIELPEKLKNSNLKYVLLSSPDEKNYTKIATGDFNQISNNELIILRNQKQEKTTIYYKLYVYIDGTTNNSNNENNEVNLIINIEAETK